MILVIHGGWLLWLVKQLSREPVVLVTVSQYDSLDLFPMCVCVCVGGGGGGGGEKGGGDDTEPKK